MLSLSCSILFALPEIPLLLHYALVAEGVGFEVRLMTLLDTFMY